MEEYHQVRFDNLYMSQSLSAVICGRRFFFGVGLGGVVEALLLLVERLDVEVALETIDPPPLPTQHQRRNADHRSLH